MSQITLLECREAAAAQNNANGDWQTVLNAPQMLMPGDQVILKTAALDTRKATTGTITLENDVPASISGYPYVVDYLTDYKEYVQTTAFADFQRYYAAELRQAHTGDNNDYKLITGVNIANKKAGAHDVPKSSFTMNYKTPPPLLPTTIVKPTAVGQGNDTVLVLVTDYNLALTASNGVMFIKSTKTEPDVTFTFAGSFIDGATVTNTVVIAANSIQAGVPFFLPKKCTVLHTITVNGAAAAKTKGTVTVGTVSNVPGNGSVRINVPHSAGEFGQPAVNFDISGLNIAVDANTGLSDITYTNFSKNALTGRFSINKTQLPKYNATAILSPVTVSHSHFQPLLFTHNFTIPAGTYQPDALCSFINSSITLNNAQTTDDPVLLNNDMMKSSTLGGKGVTTFFVSESNASGDRNAFTFSNDDDKGSWMGSSSIQLGVNSNTNCFEWQYLHTPYYDSLSAAGPEGTGIPPVLYEQNTAGVVSTSVMMGIALNGLTPSSFWEDQLGFDVTYASYKNNASAVDMGTITGVLLPNFDVTITTNTTAQFVGTDSVVIKAKNPQMVSGFTANPNITPHRQQFVSTANLDNFLPVKAPTAYTTLAKDTTGYFLLDVQTNFKTETVGSTDTSRTIQAIVGRFYNTGSFTIAGSDSGIVYQHVGTPQMIQSLSIRILHPDGTLADDVGNDSTLYFEIQRQIK